MLKRLCSYPYNHCFSARCTHTVLFFLKASPSRSLGTTVSRPDPVISSQRVSGGVAVANLIDLDFDTSSAAAASSMEGLCMFSENF